MVVRGRNGPSTVKFGKGDMNISITNSHSVSNHTGNNNTNFKNSYKEESYFLYFNLACDVDTKYSGEFNIGIS